jgi:WD40 repeat protein
MKRETAPFPWRTVRIFISSTFRDFHAERDDLVKHVFPELRQWCERWRLHLVDVDLRWGITAAEAESGKAIDICLEQIDQSRPFFLCMLGGRYGWVPRPDDISVPIRRRYERLRDEEKYSVTHLEIQHAVLEPLTSLDALEEAPHAFFYFRDTTSLPDPSKLASFSEAERREYAQVFFEADRETAEKLSRLKENIRQHYEALGRASEHIYTYSPIFDPSLASPEDDRLKGRITDQSLRDFGLRVIGDLKNAIALQYPDRIQNLNESRSSRERDEESELQDAYVENKSSLFVGRQEIRNRLRDYAKGNPGKVLALIGEPGSGKSALLARFYTELRDSERLVIRHFVGASPASTSLPSLLKRLCSSLLAMRPEKDAVELPDEPQQLEILFLDCLAKTAADVTIIIDAVNQLEDRHRAHELRWMPSTLPPNVRMIVSSGSDAVKVIKNIPSKTDLVLELPLLEDDERTELIGRLPSVFCKSLEKQHADALLAHPGTRNPLYLKVALEELRVFGSFEKLGDKIRQLPANVTDLFVAVLDRLEQDHDTELVSSFFCLLEHSQHGLSEKELAELLSECRLHNRYPVLLRQVREYLYRRQDAIGFFHSALSAAVRKKYPGEPEAWHRRLANYFASEPVFESADQVYLRKVVEQPYQQARAGMTESLRETLSDLEFLYGKNLAIGTARLIEDYNLIRPKPTDFRLIQQALVLSSYALAKEPRQLPGQLLGRIPDSVSSPVIDRLRRDAKSWNRSSWLRPSTSALTSVGGILTGIFKNHQSEVLCLAGNERRQLLVSGSLDHTIKVWDIETGEEINSIRTGQSTVGAVAVTPDGRRIASASANRQFGDRDFTVKIWDVDTGEQIRVLDGHAESVRCLTFTADGRSLLSGSDDKTIRIWDTESGEVRRILHGHEDEVKCLAVSPDTRRVISGSFLMIHVWDFETGAPIRTIEAHNSTVHGLAVTPDGKRFLSVCGDVFLKHITRDGRRIVHHSMDYCMKAWDLESGSELRMLTGHSSSVKGLAIFPDGSKAVTASFDGTVRIWDLDTYESLMKVEAHESGVARVALADAGHAFTIAGYCNASIPEEEGRPRKRALDYRIKMWDFNMPQPVKDHPFHFGSIFSAAMASSAGRAITGSYDGRVKVWDSASGRLQQTIEDGSGMVLSVAVTPDARKLVTSSDAFDVTVWDIQKAARKPNVLDRIRHRLTKKVKGAKSLKVKGQATAVAISPDGRTVAFADSMGSLHLWRVGRRAYRIAPTEHTSLWFAFSDDGTTLFAIDFERKAFLEVVCASGEVRRRTPLDTEIRIKSQYAERRRAAFSAGARRAVAIGQATQEPVFVLLDLQAGKEIWKLAPPNGDQPYSVAIAGDGRRAVLSTLKSNTIYLLDLDGRKVIADFTIEGMIKSAAIDEGGTDLVVGQDNGRVHLFRLNACA